MPRAAGRPGPIRCAALLAALLAPLAAASLAHAQAAYPTRPLSLIVPLPPGGTTDAISRAVAERMAADLGRPVVIDNRPGAGANVTYQHAARVPADGYTLLMGINSLAVNPALQASLAYAPQRDFAPVSMVARGAFILAVNPATPWRTVPELIAAARANPGGIDQASTGVGSLNHLAGALFAARAGVSFGHVPYRGGAQASTDVVAGRVPLIFLAILEALPLVQDGRLRGLAVTSPAPSPAAPNLPTVAEAAPLPGYAVEFWQGIFVPAGTPAPVIARLNRAVAAAMADAALVADFARRGITLEASSPEALEAILRDETETWARVVRETGVRPE
jgi:tripartite-type tricarboxylate transporter receptor subunit TctC